MSLISCNGFIYQAPSETTGNTELKKLLATSSVMDKVAEVMKFEAFRDERIS
ncbi:MAG: hypothetical protein R3F15_14120 [Lysobacterales bacterium]